MTDITSDKTQIESMDYDHEQRCVMCRTPTFTHYKLSHWADDEAVCAYDFIDVLDESIGAGELVIIDTEDDD